MISKKIKTGLALGLWIGSVMFIGSLFLGVLLGKDLKKMYFTESYLFYEICIVLICVFIAGFFLDGKKQ